MDVSQLKGFCAVVEEGGFCKAAKKVFLTQPAITLQVKSLEDELEMPLLLRDKKRVRTTDAGRVLYRHAKRIFAEIGSAEQEIAEIRGMKKGHLTIGCSDTVSSYILNTVLEHFIKEFPHIELTVKNKTTPEIVQLLTDHSIDIGIAPFAGSTATLSYEKLLSYCEVAVCSTSHPLAKRKYIDLATLAQYRLLVLEEGTQTRTLLEQDFRQHQITPSAIMEVGSVDVQKSFAAIDMGVAIIPEFAVDRKRDELLAVISIRKLPKRKLGILTRDRSSISPAAKAFHSILKADVPHFS